MREITSEDLRAVETSALRRAIGVNLVAFTIFSVGSALFAAVQIPEFPLLRGYLMVLPFNAAYFLVASILVIRRFRRVYRGSISWISQSRPPSTDERRSLLALPRQTSLHIFFSWLLAVGIIPFAGPVLGVRLSALVVAKSAGAVLAASIPAFFMTHLVIEQALRPLRARVLSKAGEPAPDTMSMRARLLFAWLVSSGVPFLIIAFMLVGLDDRQLARSVPLIWASCAGAAFAGIAVTAYTARAITDPIHRVRGGLLSVRSGDLGPEIPIEEAGELGQLQSGFNEMVTGLRERERLRDLFGRHVGSEVVAKALAEEPRLEGETLEATAVFVDVIGSTPLAESLPPRDVLAKLNDFFDAVVRDVTSEGGMVNQFQGDGAVCIFGAPLEQPDHAARALRATRSLLAELENMPGISAAIGISSGSVVAGNIGTLDRYEYTVIGDPVNEASRLCDAAKDTDSRILVSGSTIRKARAAGDGWVASGPITLRGRSVPTETFTTSAT